MLCRTFSSLGCPDLDLDGALALVAKHGLDGAELRVLGGTIDLLASMPDFQLVRLTPHRARLVVGFGQAFELDPRDWSVKSRVTN